MKKIVIALLPALLLMASSFSHAAMYTHEVEAGHFDGYHSSRLTHDGIFTSYDDVTEMFTFQVDGAEMTTKKRRHKGKSWKNKHKKWNKKRPVKKRPMDGFWLVVNNSDAPDATDTNENTIFYADVKREQVWAYAFNGLSKEKSWRRSDLFLKSFDLNVDGDSVSFSIDNSTLQKPDDAGSEWDNWSGTSFDETIGVWFQPIWGLESCVGKEGMLSHWRARGKTGWYDVSNIPTKPGTSEVPIPASAVLFLSGLMGLFSMRVKRSA